MPFCLYSTSFAVSDNAALKLVVITSASLSSESSVANFQSIVTWKSSALEGSINTLVELETDVHQLLDPLQLYSVCVVKSVKPVKLHNWTLPPPLVVYLRAFSITKPISIAYYTYTIHL